MEKTFTLAGWTVKTAEQARSILVMLKLQGYSSNSSQVQQALSVIEQLERN